MSELEISIVLLALMAIAYRFWFKADIYVVEWRFLTSEGRMHLPDWEKRYGSQTLKLMKLKVTSREGSARVYKEGMELVVRNFYRFSDFSEARYTFEKYKTFSPPPDYVGCCVCFWKAKPSLFPWWSETIVKGNGTLLEKSKPRMYVPEPDEKQEGTV